MRDLTASEISVKVKQITEKGCILLLYKTARVDAQILDETFGADHWTNDFKEIKGNLYCGIGVKQEDGSFIWKWDCGSESVTDAEKGEASDSFRRAGFKWGIGVELYTSPFIWASVETVKNQKGFYELADKFMKFSISDIEIKNKRITRLTIINNNGVVVYEMGKKSKPIKPDFAKEAAAAKAAQTKAINKAIAAGTNSYEQPKPQKPLSERYEASLKWLKEQTPETYRKATRSQIDYVNNLCAELKEKGSVGWLDAIMSELNRLTDIKDNIPY